MASAEDYARAEQFLGWNADKLAFKLTVTPNWIEGSDRFWYKLDTRDGKEFVLVDPARRSRRPAFDHARLAAALSTAQAEAAASAAAAAAATAAEGAEPAEAEEQPPAPPQQPTAVEAFSLPFDSFEFSEDGRSISFTAGTAGWTCDIVGYSCSPSSPSIPVPHELISPDEAWALYAEGDNLWVRPLTAEGEPVQLTTDGEPHYGYGSSPEGRTSTIMEKRFGIRLPPAAAWSPDSKYVVSHRLDEREVGEFHLVEGAPAAGARPVHWSYKMAIVGDEAVPLAELVVIDVEAGSFVKIDADPIPAILASPISFQYVFWNKTGDRVYFVTPDRGDRRMRLFEADPATGEARLLVEESSATHIDLNPQLGMPPNVRVLSDRGEVIWFSERDGWGHLYLYDLADGTLTNQITRGPWLVRDIVHVDEASGTIWFTGAGREEGRDPYYPHLYSIGTDGSNLRLLSPEDAHHTITAAESGDFFTDTYSRLDLPPTTVLRGPEGRVVLELEEADIERLLATGWQFPERFTVKAADGVTDLYGALFKPTHFDPEKSYPVIDDIYPGPQAARTPKTFTVGGESQSLAELGFVTFFVDGRGTPLRSKAFHDYSYRNLQSGGAIEDHIAALEQLKTDHAYLDLDRVGIYGWSGGGFASVNAMLHYPEFYRVAVSGAGNHDQRSYTALWGEKYHGLPEDTDYVQQANSTHAANLEGKLLLLMPEIDDNVHPTQTVRLIDALIKANKDFDMVLLPGTHHGPIFKTPYITRKRWDYFVEHLLGVEPPEGYEIAPVPPEYYARLYQR